MKHLSSCFLLVGLLITVTFVSCIKDNEGFEEVTDFGESEIFGFVTNVDNEPIAGAEVTYRGKTAFTDTDGIYRLTDVQVGPQHNGLKIEKDGYFEGSRTFRTATAGTLYQTTILQEKSFDHSFQSNTNAEIVEEQVTIEFPANAIVFEDTGEPYEGQVLVAISPIDPTEDQLSERMPGDLSAINDDNTISTLESFGIVYVEMQDPSGTKLQIAENKTVQLSYRIAPALRSSAPATIPMWSYDFDLGAWKEEGQAAKSADGVKYVGAVSHFSCWNYDVAAPSIIVTGVVFSNELGLVNFTITIFNASNKGGRGKTDNKGQFSGRVEAGVPLILTITSNSDCPVTFSMPVGPFDTDTDLGIIEVDNVLIAAISGTALDCDQNPLAMGRLYVADQVFPITDGVIDIFAHICANDGFVDIRIVDEISMKEVILLDVALAEKIDLGEVIVCEEGLNLTVDNLDGQPTVLSDPLAEIRFNEFNNFTRLEISSDAGSIPFSKVVLLLGPNDDWSLSVGEYEITEATFDNGTDIFSAAANPVGTVTVESTSESSFGTVLKGVYSVETESTDSEQRVITGSFKVNVR